MPEIKLGQSSSASNPDQSSSGKSSSTEKTLSSIRKRFSSIVTKQPSNGETVNVLLDAEDEFLSKLDRACSNLGLNCSLLAATISDLEKSMKLSRFYLSVSSKMGQELVGSDCDVSKLRSVMSTVSETYSDEHLGELKDRFYSDLEKTQQEAKLSAEEIKVTVDLVKKDIESLSEKQSTPKKQREIKAAIEKISKIASTVATKSSSIQDEAVAENVLLENSAQALVAELTKTRNDMLKASKEALLKLTLSGLGKNLASEINALLSGWEENSITRDDTEMSQASILLDDASKARKSLLLLIKAKNSLARSKP
ncbi:hypothetical protein [Candidatus Ichthyocystis hellenicum]|uniref:hypothetical protein n=1 Tax=Candidatus Ichthyocystis hellenicum TaxID=1561003 RepID=UPI000B84EBC6|nr:hypothetical protein [Candidatus Ichthyocystis hellenicum]